MLLEHAVPLSVTVAEYGVFVRDSFGILGNSVLLECHVPFTSFVSVDSWLVYDGTTAVLSTIEYARNDYGRSWRMQSSF